MEELIARINFLARKSCTEGLTEEELAEQKKCRDEYRAAIRRSLSATLDSIEFVEGDSEKGES